MKKSLSSGFALKAGITNLKKYSGWVIVAIVTLIY